HQAGGATLTLARHESFTGDRRSRSIWVAHHYAPWRHPGAAPVWKHAAGAGNGAIFENLRRLRLLGADAIEEVGALPCAHKQASAARQHHGRHRLELEEIGNRVMQVWAVG